MQAGSHLMAGVRRSFPDSQGALVSNQSLIQLVLILEGVAQGIVTSRNFQPIRSNLILVQGNGAAGSLLCRDKISLPAEQLGQIQQGTGDRQFIRVSFIQFQGPVQQRPGLLIQAQLGVDPADGPSMVACTAG